MLVIDHHILHGLQRDVNNIFYFIEALVRRRLATSLLQVKSQVVDAPFGAMLLVVVVTLLLDGYVSQVDHHVVKVGDFRGVLLIAKSCEPFCGEPHLEWSVTCNEYIDTQIELLAPDEQRLVYVTRDDVCLAHDLRLRWNL